MALRGVYLLIKGRVQGVCFRYYTRIEAENLKLSGWVRNISDGRVEVLAEGEDSQLEALISFCSKGPAMAKVSELDSKYLEYSGKFSGFSIEPDV